MVFYEIDLEFLDTFFYCKNFLKSIMIKKFTVFESSTFISTNACFPIFFFKEDGRPVKINSISLENSSSSRGDLERWKLGDNLFEVLNGFGMVIGPR